jgi:hypothetical protein
MRNKINKKKKEAENKDNETEKGSAGSENFDCLRSVFFLSRFCSSRVRGGHVMGSSSRGGRLADPHRRPACRPLNSRLEMRHGLPAERNNYSTSMTHQIALSYA